MLYEYVEWMKINEVVVNDTMEARCIMDITFG